jgi:ssDNA-binding Zn-finger/Zn-ribbon topoisomerase 1
MSDPAKECTKCGDEMVIRSGRYGSFWGCSGYPECTNKEKLDVEERHRYDQPQIHSTIGNQLQPLSNIYITRKELFTGFALLGLIKKHNDQESLILEAIQIGEKLENGYAETNDNTNGEKQNVMEKK